MLSSLDDYIQEDYLNIKNILEEKLIEAFLNGSKEFIFNVADVSKYNRNYYHRGIRNKLRQDIEECEGVKKTTVETLSDHFDCECHKKCRTFKALFRKNKLKCGRDCARWVECNRSHTYCPRENAKKLYKARSSTPLLFIYPKENFINDKCAEL